MREIGKNIRQHRIKNKMSQDELAEKLFVTRQTVSNYETGRSRPDVEMLARISEILGTDINSLIYGEPKTNLTDTQKRQLLFGVIILSVLIIIYLLFAKPAKVLMTNYYISGPRIFLEYIILPLIYVLGSWSAMRVISLYTKAKPIGQNWVKYIRTILFSLLLFYFVLMLPSVYHGIKSMLVHAYVDEIRDDLLLYFHGYSSAFSLAPGWLGKLHGQLWLFISGRSYIFFLFGLLLWLFDFPRKEERNYISVLIALMLSVIIYLCADEKFEIEVFDPSRLGKLPYGIEVIQKELPEPEWEIN